MIDLQNIEENYKRMPVSELMQLSQNPGELRLDVIPILQRVLLEKGKYDEALSLTDFLVKGKEKPRFKDFSSAELRKVIDERLESGESLESIKIDLKDDGVNIFDVINEDNKLKDKAFDYLTDLKQQGLEENEINDKLSDTLFIDKDDIEMLKVQLRKRGRQNLIIGFTIVVVSLILLMISFGIGGQVTIGGIIFLCVGIWRVSEGYKQSKK